MSILTVPPNWDLPTLNVFIAQQENFLRGPLTAIGTQGDVTVIEIDDKSSDNPPERNAAVTIGPPPPKATVIGSGTIYLNNAPVTVTAYRPG